MKKIIITILFLISTIYAQELKTVIDPKTEKPMLVGVCDRSAFADTNFSGWFNSEYNSYSIDKETLAILEPADLDFTLTVVLGTWCSDSRREVPRILKIIDYLKIPEEKISFINVDREKHSPEGEVDELDIQLVPTFIFFKGEEEIGRIIEVPEITLEEDLVGILISNPD